METIPIDTVDPMTTEVHLTSELAQQMPQLRRVVVTTGRGDPEADRVRRIATRLAGQYGWELVLYDRSHERWTDHPHPTGPVTADELEGDDWEHLRVQLRDIEAAGVHATAWLATVPSLTAMIDTFQATDVDAVMLSADPSKPRLMERLLVGDNPAHTVKNAAANLVPEKAPTFLVVDGNDIRIATDEETS